MPLHGEAVSFREKRIHDVVHNIILPYAVRQPVQIGRDVAWKVGARMPQLFLDETRRNGALVRVEQTLETRMRVTKVGDDLAVSEWQLLDCLQEQLWRDSWRCEELAVRW